MDLGTTMCMGGGTPPLASAPASAPVAISALGAPLVPHSSGHDLSARRARSPIALAAHGAAVTYSGGPTYSWAARKHATSSGGTQKAAELQKEPAGLRARGPQGHSKGSKTGRGSATAVAHPCYNKRASTHQLQ